MSNNIILSPSSTPNAGTGALPTLPESDKTDKDVNGVALLILHYIGNNKWACRIVLEYHINEDFYKQVIFNFNARILNESPKDFRCNELVLVPEKFKSLEKTLAKVDFPLKIGSAVIQCNISTVRNGLQANVSSSGEPKYTFGMIFYNNSSLEIEISYLHTLQRWCRIGEESGWFCKRKGLPTAKVIMTLMMRKLGVTKDNLKKIYLHSQNILTNFLFMFELFENKKTMEASYAHSHSSQLNAELAHTLGGKLYLKRVRCPGDEQGTYTESFHDRFKSTAREREFFLSKPLVQYFSLDNFEKFIVLRSTTGVDVLEDNVIIPNITKLSYEFVK